MTTTPAHTITTTSTSSFSSTTTSESTTHSSADTVSTADTTSKSVSHGVSYGSFSSTTHSVADTVSHAETRSWARTTSVADGVATGTTRAHGTSRSSGTAVARSLGTGASTGISMAVAPTFSLSRGYQWFNDVAAQFVQILRAQEELLRRATLDGAFLTDVYLLTRTERGAAVAEAAVRQAFQGAGPLVVTPVQSRVLRHPAEQAYIRRHALAFTPSTRRERVAGALEVYRDSTLLLPEQLAAYTTPVLFEEGMSVTTQERIPAFAFVPDMPGDVVLGHQFSTERGELTAAPLRMSPDRFFHTVFAADTGFGKTVAAERLVVETTLKWHFRTVVLDFGAGWRRLLNAPIPAGRVEVWQLFPGALVPFRWNPWQVGKRIQPERQYVATCEIFKNAGRMGPRQLGFMRRAARQLYLEYGVLTSDREVWADPNWNKVRDADEEEAINAARRERGLPERACVGEHLGDLEGFERQALAVHRSKRVDMSAWVERLASYRPELEKRRDQASLQSLEGVLLRLEPFTQGEMARMYGSGEDTLAVEDLGLLGPPDDPWGISILEGGAELDEYAKAAILGLVAWHLYNDAVVRRRQNIGKSVPDPTLQIVFEEANKVLTGVETDASENQTGGATTVELFQAMWRDGRKYRIFLHPVVQTVSELPPGILSSCNNGFFSQTKNPKDRDLIMAHLAFSEKGFTDEDYKRFLSRMPAAMAIAKLGYSQDIVHTTPFLVRPLMVPAREPTDEEIYEAMRLMGKVR
ncbi:MAG: serine-rich protein [Armatimonadota bacterium]|nr:serine-rich protein [Armatimonadota bacterium]